MKRFASLQENIFKTFKPGNIGQANPGTLVFIVLGFFCLFFLIASLFGFHLERLFIFFLVITTFLIALVNTNASLIILIFSMLFSPSISVGSVQPREILIRMDDVILLIICFTWLMKMAINKKLGFLKFTPLNIPLLLYIAACIISTSLGVIDGQIQFKKAFFYTLKYFEYFILYFMVVNNLSDLNQIKKFTVFIFIVCVLVALYTYPQILRGEKTTAPFQTMGGEPNTLSGYELLILAVATGILLYSKTNFWQFSCIGLILCALPSFLYTQSRGGYIGFIFMYLGLILFSQRKKAMLIIILIGALFIAPLIMPRVITQRVTSTFELPGKNYKFLGFNIHLEESAAARVESLAYSFDKWKEKPFFGHGVAPLSLFDIQYGRVLVETGLVGFGIFLWLLFTIFKTAKRALKFVQDDWSRGLIVGFLAGFIGLIFHAFSADTFVIIRIMEPFWFFVAMINFLSTESTA